MVNYENKSKIYGSVLVNEMPKSARYHIDRANSIVFTSKRLPLQPVSSERNHQVADCHLAIISKDEISIIKHARKSVLFNHGKPWTKKDSNSLFDVTMSSYDGAEICELVGLFILNKLGQKSGKENIGLYRDDGLAIMTSKSARLADKSAHLAVSSNLV